MSGLLDRPGDEPAPEEEAAIDRLGWRERKELIQTMFSLKNSSRRALEYVKAVKFDDYRLERRVTDRLLDKLLEIKPSLKQMPLEEAIERSRRG